MHIGQGFIDVVVIREGEILHISYHKAGELKEYTARAHHTTGNTSYDTIIYLRRAAEPIHEYCAAPRFGGTIYKLDIKSASSPLHSTPRFEAFAGTRSMTKYSSEPQVGYQQLNLGEFQKFAVGSLPLVFLDT